MHCFLKKKNINFLSLSHSDRVQTNILEIESEKELENDKYSKYIQSFYCDQKNKRFYYRFESENRNEINSIHQNLRSLDYIISIDIKYG